MLRRKDRLVCPVCREEIIEYDGVAINLRKHLGREHHRYCTMKMVDKAQELAREVK